MGSSPDDFPASPPPLGYMQRREPPWRYLILFLLTVVTTALAGVDHYVSFFYGLNNALPDLSLTSLLLNGLWFGLPVIVILGSHEMGHYFACRYYRVDASLPYFIPLYVPFYGIGAMLFGTLGAVIRIRQIVPGKKAMFDIGIAGPIAGFLVLIPVLLVGLHLSALVPVPADLSQGGLEFGEPLLFRAASWLTFGAVPEGFQLNAHPMVFAAWFGMLATALNLFPIGQLDGGHISYAVLGRYSTYVTLAMVACLVGLSFVSMSWIVWTVLTVAMLVVFGPRHPPVFDEDVPLDRTRRWLAFFALVMFVLCFTPTPIEPMDLVGGG
jgi:membrane-associated protease RseP (regulator of RpoE activity)